MLGVGGALDEQHGPQASVRFVAFIRNVMVGRGGLSADALRRMTAEAGGRGPRSHLATGNLTFTASADSVEEIRLGLERSIESVLGRAEDVFVRSVASLAAAVRADPFAEMMAADVYERCVTFLPTDTPLTLSLPIQTARGDAVLFAWQDDEVLSVTRLVGGRPGQPGKYLEHNIGVRVTTRNWNTVERMVRLES